MTTVTFKFACGDRVRDQVTKFQGVVTAASIYMNKCVRYSVQPEVRRSEPTKMPDVYAFDEEQLELVKPAAVTVPEPRLAAARTGGPFTEAKPAR
jgi:hypothetical protein